MDIEPNMPPVQSQWSSAPPPPPSNGRFPSWAIALIVVGACGCGCLLLLPAILLPAFSQAKESGKISASLSNIKQLSTYWMMYAGDNNDVAMPKEEWNSHILRYNNGVTGLLENILLGANSNKLGYGYNGAMTHAQLGRLENVEKQIVFGLTATPGKDALLTKDSLRAADKKGETTIVSYADTHARRLKIAEAQTNSWQPKFSKE